MRPTTKEEKAEHDSLMEARLRRNKVLEYRWREETDEFCIKYVKKDSFNLSLVKNQTEEICLAAVTYRGVGSCYGNGIALQDVREQTDKICMAAVESTGLSLRYVRKQTEALCLAAVTENEEALEFVEKYYKSVADIVDNEEYKNLNK